jgi:hypothetical protein
MLAVLIFLMIITTIVVISYNPDLYRILSAYEHMNRQRKQLKKSQPDI